MANLMSGTMELLALEAAGSKKSSKAKCQNCGLPYEQHNDCAPGKAMCPGSKGKKEFQAGGPGSGRRPGESSQAAASRYEGLRKATKLAANYHNDKSDDTEDVDKQDAHSEASSHFQSASDHYKAARDAAKKGDFATSDKHAATADSHLDKAEDLVRSKKLEDDSSNDSEDD